MKHSLRFRLPVLFLVLFVCFLATLLVSISAFFRDEVRFDIARQTQSYQNTVTALARAASAYSSEDDIIRYLAAHTPDDRKVELYDDQNKLLWSKGQVRAVLQISVGDYILSRSGARYGLRVSGNYPGRAVLFEDYASRWLWIILLLFALLFLGMALALHFTITRPILALYRRMEADPLHNKARARSCRRDEIGGLEQRFDQMLERLQTEDRQQQTMLAAISHDLRTPLTSILSYTERLAVGKVQDEQKRRHYYDVIHRKAQDIQVLIDHFQEAAEAGSFDRKLQLETVPAAAFWKAACEACTEGWDAAQAVLEWNGDVNASAVLRLEPLSMRRVLANLLENARKYGARPLRVRVSLTVREHMLHLRVENNGAQVPEEKLPLLFDRFYRAEPSRSRERGGSGLGLFICREIVEQHGGSIRAYKPWDMDFGVEMCLPLVES
ncbi:sensor histidine kinase [Ethanoligenens harbinense]|uniref:histidine kinase n=1 Tax=Ethanoligenens harbinense (strain DSM 18485 / JCM 12961 / CGMCC 1.5033 / YUAN-3) TaxID=663278 RepID=E6U9H6_ETHHY|nr:HAMP domain-containing sensor histidine kinase [Ethanoligenens harbinense]ADU26167.1 integral membrane sensor signal transduction histidine kinase [Ethanoligenens harbinense YUAN-3]AVQ95305.1 sensor histidine kinase [Ethanoligenens harbinense YUAN-3]AYF37969.1 sensor histidine kinase [Ethanoligenens harbinense]AYF40716.1 sensor histidine kinase [Ethanoligenens harbinense]QCN91549.1 sensor histidine kinase [Ethanoligenens harbinense]